MRLTVLGLGSIGMRHAMNLKDLGADVVGFDPNIERRNAAESRNISTAADRENAVDSADGCVIASPSPFHLDDLRLAIDRHCHAFVEKPFAHRTDGVSDVLSRADQENLTVFAGHNLRYHPCIAKAREILDNGDIGELIWGHFTCSSFLPEWRPNEDYRLGYAADPRTGGVIFDNIHEIDLAAYLLGPIKVQSAIARRTGHLDIPAEDCADIFLCHRTGQSSTVHIDYATRFRQRRIEIAGTNGFLSLDLRTRTLCHHASDGTAVSDYQGPGTGHDDYVAEAAHFMACIEGRDTPKCDGHEALSVLAEVIEARRLAGLPGI